MTMFLLKKGLLDYNSNGFWFLLFFGMSMDIMYSSSEAACWDRKELSPGPRAPQTNPWRLLRKCSVRKINPGGTKWIHLQSHVSQIVFWFIKLNYASSNRIYLLSMNYDLGPEKFSILCKTQLIQSQKLTSVLPSSQHSLVSLAHQKPATGHSFEVIASAHALFVSAEDSRRINETQGAQYRDLRDVFGRPLSTFVWWFCACFLVILVVLSGFLSLFTIAFVDLFHGIRVLFCGFWMLWVTLWRRVEPIGDTNDSSHWASTDYCIGWQCHTLIQSVSSAEQERGWQTWKNYEQICNDA